MKVVCLVFPAFYTRSCEETIIASITVFAEIPSRISVFKINETPRAAFSILGTPLKKRVRDHRQTLDINKTRETRELLYDPEVVFIAADGPREEFLPKVDVFYLYSCLLHTILAARVTEENSIAILSLTECL